MYKETIKKLTIVKKKQFSRTNVFIQNRSISFDKQTFFDFKNEFIIPVCQTSQLLKRQDVIAIQKMVMNYALLSWFSFLKCQRRYPNMFSRPNF